MLALITSLLLCAATCEPVAPPHLFGPPEPTAPAPGAVFLEACNIARDNFYDSSRVGADWEHTRDELLPAARNAATPAETSRLINQALERLHASHTRHFHQGQREYYELLDIFYPDGVPPGLSPRIPEGPVSYVGVGVVARVIDGHTFATDVYPTGPADRAGILVGDELISVEGAPWSDIDPFRDREGILTSILIRRAPTEEPRTLHVAPRRIRPKQLFLAALNASAHVIERDSRRVGYVRLRSYASPDYQDALVELTQTRFKDCDALLLDLRGPWGGANPEYLNLFNPLTPSLESKPREGAWEPRAFTWRKPVALCIDADVRSGKEILAHAFRTRAIGPLIGERTGGAVLAGRPFILSDGSVLYLAVSDVRVDGIRLEGVGVEPTIRVERAIPFCAGKDPVIDAGVEALTTPRRP